MVLINYKIESADWKKKFPSFKKYINKTVNETTKGLKNKSNLNSSVSFLLTSDKNIKKLNYKYRKKNKPTNVLSFPMMMIYDNINLLGDIALASETLLNEASEQNISKYDYLSKMTIHGMLHLLGYDHKTSQQFKVMSRLENTIYKRVKGNK